jgi:hypothetical protein
MFLQSHAIKGLAQYRALQSRLNTAITSAVESFEVMKLSFEKDFKLTKGLQENITHHALAHSPKDVIEYFPQHDNNQIYAQVLEKETEI